MLNTILIYIFNSILFSILNETALHIACKEGNVELVRLLLAQSSIKTDIKNQVFIDSC